MEGYIFYARALEALMGRESLQLPMGTNRSRLLGFNGGRKMGSGVMKIGFVMIMEGATFNNVLQYHIS